MLQSAEFQASLGTLNTLDFPVRFLLSNAKWRGASWFSLGVKSTVLSKLKSSSTFRKVMYSRGQQRLMQFLGKAASGFHSAHFAPLFANLWTIVPRRKEWTFFQPIHWHIFWLDKTIEMEFHSIDVCLKILQSYGNSKTANCTRFWKEISSTSNNLD